MSKVFKDEPADGLSPLEDFAVACWWNFLRLIVIVFVAFLALGVVGGLMISMVLLPNPLPLLGWAAYTAILGTVAHSWVKLPREHPLQMFWE